MSQANKDKAVLVSKLPLGNPESEALASQDGKPELPAPNSQAGTWELTELNSLFVHVIGGDWGKDQDFDHPDFVDAVCIRGAEFKHWNKDRGATASIRKIKNSSLQVRQLVEGDILIEISGGGPDQPVGRTVLIDDRTLNQFAGKPIVCTNFLRLARPASLVNSTYLNSYLNSFYLSGDVKNYQGGSNNLRNLKFKEYSQISIPVPPLAEQQQIAAKLDELLVQVDTLKTRLNTLPKILKRFRESILADAVSGKLTEDWRETNSFDVNNEILEIKRVRDEEFNLIAEKQFQRTGQNSRKLDFSTINEDSPLREIPNEWKLIQLGEIICYLTDYHANGSYEVLKEHVELKESEDYACMIRATNFEKNNFSNLMIYITEEAYQFLEKSKLFGGEILIGKIGNAGSVYLMPNLNRPASLAMNLFAIRFSKKLVDSKYIFYFLKSHVGDRNIQKYVRGVATKSIDKKSLRSVYINLPSYKEQTEIVQRVEQLFTYADQIEQRVKDAQARVNHLTQAILAKAFRGELTADWREQNPDLISGENSAEALLARIKEERHSQEHNKVTKLRTIKKSGESMKSKGIIPIIEALKAAGQPLSSQNLLVQSGYPNDATIEQLEAFFLDIRGQLNAKAITRNRQGDQEFFALAE